jgi:peroxiredoxin
MYLLFNSRRASANDVKWTRMIARNSSIRRLLLVPMGLLALAAATLHIEASMAADRGMVGHRAADFGLPALAGSNVRLSEYGGQPVILTFWGSGCGACGPQLAALDRLYTTYRTAGLVTLGISVDDNMVHAREYARLHSTSYPLLLDVSKDVSRSFSIDRLPTTVMIDRSGVVRYLHAGEPYDERVYVAQIRALLDDDVAIP